MTASNHAADLHSVQDGMAAARNFEPMTSQTPKTETHHSIGLAEDAGPFDCLLLEILATLRWRGEHRRLFESLPHLQQIGSFTMLRTVLDRLDVGLSKVERYGRQLSARDLPYLVVNGGACWLVRSIDGKAQAYSPATPSESVDVASLNGTIYLLRMNKADESAWTPVDKFVGSVVRGLRKHIVRIAAYSAAISGLGVGLSLYILLVYDLAIATESLDTLGFLAIGAAVALGLELYIYMQRSKRIAYIASRFDGIVQVKALSAVINLPLALTERAALASQLARFRQFELGRELFAGRLASALFDLPFTLLFLAMLFVIGGPLGFVPLGIGLIMIALAIFSVPASLTHTAKVAASRLKADAMLLELATKSGALHGASAEAAWIARYGRKLASYERARFDSARQTAAVQITTSALITFAGVATLAVGAGRVIDGTLSLGGLVACMIIVWRMLLPVQIVSLNLPRLWQLRTTLRQIDDLMRMRPERDEAAPLVYRRLGGSISTSGLYLNLGTRQEPQLRAVSMDIRAGEIVVVTGPNGSGKSTLLKVLLGLYPQYMGTVRLGGLDMRQLDPAEIRAAIGYASDDRTFFYGTVAGNLRFAFPDATDHDIVEALAAAGIRLPHPDLPEGIETRISATAAHSFSQGMLCRLALARAFVKKSSIILLDAAHSGLDPVGDAALITHLSSLRGQTTVVLVSAQPSHMQIADRIIVMNAGTVVANGQPDNIIPTIMENIRAGAV